MWHCLLLDMVMGAFLGNSITVLFYEHHGLTPSEVLTVQSSLSLAIVVADIPAGHVADRFGVPRSVLFGTTLQTIQSLLFAPLYGFGAFETLAICTGISWCFLTNTTSSIMQSQRDNELFGAYRFRFALIRPSVQAGSALLGGYLAQLGDVDLPYIVQPCINVCGIVVAWRLVVLSRGSNISRPKHALWHSIKASVRTMLVASPQVRWLVILTAVNNVAFASGLWLLQLQLKSTGVQSLTVFGALYAIRALLAGLFGSLKRLVSLPLVKGQAVVFGVAAGMALAAALPVGWIDVVALVVGGAFLEGLLVQIQEVKLKELLPERYENRTTELSVNTAVRSAVYFAAAYELGGIPLNMAFLAVGLGILTCGGLALWRFRVAVRSM
jgi:MFS family permease